MHEFASGPTSGPTAALAVGMPRFIPAALASLSLVAAAADHASAQDAACVVAPAPSSAAPAVVPGAAGPAAPVASSSARSTARQRAQLDLGLALVLGTATPEGQVGVELSAGVTRYAQVAGGLGIDYRGAVMVSAMGRAMLAPGAIRPYLGVGVSRAHGTFLDVEGGLEVERGWYFYRFDVGYARGHSSCPESQELCHTFGDHAYVGAAVGGRWGVADAPADPDPEPTPSSPASPQDRAWRVTAEAREWARNGRCDVVRKAGADVARLDRAYYEGVFLRDDTIAPCLR